MSPKNKKGDNYILLISMVTTIFVTFLFCPKCYRESNPIVLSSNLIYCLICGFLYWKINTWNNQWSNRIYSWLDYPIRRIILGITFFLILTSVQVWTMNYLFFVYLARVDWADFLSRYESYYIILSNYLISFIVWIILLGRSFFREWLDSTYKMEKLKAEQVSTQFNVLRNQVNPHFLFNSLNALSSLVHENATLAEQYILKMSGIYRYVLESQKVELISFEQEWKYVKDFIFLQKIKSENQLEITWDENLEKLECMILPLSLQMLLENAIKHNVISMKNTLKVKIYTEGNKLVVWNSKTKEKLHKDSTGLGLKNIRERYEFLSSKKVEVMDEAASFTVKLPFLEIEHK